MKTKLEKFRTRWFRWLGQKTREDRDTWVELLDCNWSGWPTKVLGRVGLSYPSISIQSGRDDVYYIFNCAIAEATMEELGQLDNIFCTEYTAKKFGGVKS